MVSCYIGILLVVSTSFCFLLTGGGVAFFKSCVCLTEVSDLLWRYLSKIPAVFKSQLIYPLTAGVMGTNYFEPVIKSSVTF